MTPSKTLFAGYEVLQPGDPLSSDGFAFQFENPQIADRLDKIGAILHRHDAHAAMANPSTAGTATTAATGGSIPAATTVHVCYTLTDADGGETLPTTPITVTTAAGYSTPGAPSVAVDYTSGSLLAGTPLYAITVSDGAGGETALGDATALTVAPGHANAEADLSGLTALTNTASGSSTSAGWRVWRSVDGGSSWNLMGTGAYSTDTFTDTGGGGDCTVSPPATSTTQGTNTVTITVPSAGQPAGAAFFSIYADTTGLFVAPCLLATLPVSDYDAPQTYAALTQLLGQPPATSQSFPGANLINPAADFDPNGWTRAVDFYRNGLVSAGDLAGAGTASGTLVTDHLVAQRVIVPASGTLHDLAVFPATQAGTIVVAIYDTGDAVSTVRTRLWEGTVAVPAAAAWGTVGDPALAVTAGQELDIAIIANGGTASFAKWPSLGLPGFAQLPTNFIPTAGAALPKMAWEYSPGSLSAPGTIAEVSCGTISASVPIVIARVA